MNNSDECGLTAVHLVEALAARNITLRLFGGVAFRFRCPTVAGRVYSLRPHPTRDWDYVARFVDKARIELALRELGWMLDRRFVSVPGQKYSSLRYVEGGRVVRQCDIYYDGFDFCHRIDISARLKLSTPTVSLEDLLLSKLQIVRMADTDLFDIQMLMAEHKVSEGDDDSIGMGFLVKLCSDDWGLYTTIYENLVVVNDAVGRNMTLLKAEVDCAQAGIAAILGGMRSVPKTMRWRLRAIVGKRIQWYADVDDVA